MLYYKAMNLMYEKHKGQVDKGGYPYYMHPVAVSRIVDRNGGTEEMVIAALLHDVVEETPVTLDDLRNMGFTERIVELVDYMTRREGEGGETYWEYIERFKADKEAIMVKLADLEHNTDPKRKGYSPTLAARYNKAKEVLKAAL